MQQIIQCLQEKTGSQIQPSIISQPCTPSSPSFVQTKGSPASDSLNGFNLMDYRFIRIICVWMESYYHFLDVSGGSGSLNIKKKDFSYISTALECSCSIMN